jgi:hypothetical protein
MSKFAIVDEIQNKYKVYVKYAQARHKTELIGILEQLDNTESNRTQETTGTPIKDNDVFHMMEAR